MREKFEFVLDKLRREQRAIAQGADILDAIDYFQLAFAIEQSSIAGKNPAICVLRVSRGVRVFIIFLESPGTTVNNLAVLVNFHIDIFKRYADRIRADRIIRLRGQKRPGLGLSVNLF